MSLPEFSDEQIMLCLSGLAYRGFQDAGRTPLHAANVSAAIERGFSSMAPLQGRFELAWGPALYRGPLSLFDDKLVYVARDLQHMSRYVVAIRGTNPISIWDWLFGDLWAARQTAWRYGDGGDARVSLSSALSLSIVQGLRSEGPRRDSLVNLWQRVDERVTAARAVLDPAARALGRFAQIPPLRRLRALFIELIYQSARDPTRPGADGADARILAALALWKSNARKLVLDIVDQAAVFFGDRLDVALLALIQDEARLRATFGAGITLRTFLSAALEDADGPLDIVVTGHSKGGALSSTVALWLAETQGAVVPPEERWDPDRRARIHCFSYAGPTPGNAAFARRSDQVLGPRHLRIWNSMDVVPHAWMADDLLAIPDLYTPAIQRIPALAELVDVIRARTEPLGYAHLRGRTRQFRGACGHRQLFFDELAHQHKHAYVKEFGLGEHGVSAEILFDGEPVLPSA
jgi:hypothetical protein